MANDWLRVCWLVLLPLLQAAAKRDQALYCGACKALIDELEYAITEVESHKMIDVGSFRINPDGTQTQEKVPYAGSEVHLIELFEEICEKMKDYALSTDPVTQKRTYVRFNQRKGEDGLELKNISIDGETSKQLKYACQNVIEDHEEEILEVFRDKKPNKSHHVCSVMSELCSDNGEHDEL
ncbi:protein canopy homolog 2-like [Anneissia japonica]|uniref:protein canopy homolog 2-like n=1 Tax=Anneissia japonica TaxID=1529436 RepID=UPI0014258FE8|nr:protein canopy homolog 2-like [Anneissia japonica]